MPPAFFSCPDESLRQLYTYPCHYIQGPFTFWHTEWPQSLVTFETFDQSDEETWPDQKKYNDKDKCKYKDNDKDKYI